MRSAGRGPSAVSLAVVVGMTLEVFAQGCCTCGRDAEEPRRCGTVEPSLSEPRTVGGVTLEPRGRRLVFTGLGPRSRWVVGRGGAFSTAPFAPTLDAIEAARPDIVLVLGAFGRGARLDELVSSLSELTVPVLFLPGPRDRPSDLDEALARRAAPNLVALTGFRVLDLGVADLALVAGGSTVRYVAPGACEATEADFEEALTSTRSDRPRALVSFDAPSGTRLTAGIGGVEAGSDVARRAMERAGVLGGVFAGPDTRLDEPFDGDSPSAGPSWSLRIIVGSLTDTRLEGADGQPDPAGFPVVTIGSEGLEVELAATRPGLP